MKSCDTRDYSREIKVILDPHWVLNMRKRMIEFGQTGKADWYKAKRDNAQ